MPKETLSMSSVLWEVEKSLNDSNDLNDYDVKIQIGEGPNLEDFKAHSDILRVGSTYFDAALSSNWAKKEGDVFVFKKPNIKPDVFRIILKYIYTGTVNFDASIVDNLGELLVAADE